MGRTIGAGASRGQGMAGAGSEEVNKVVTPPHFPGPQPLTPNLRSQQ